MFAFFFYTIEYEQNQLVDTPTAGILQKGNVEINTKIYRDNGILIGTKIGLFSRFMFGVSYGGEQIVGNEEPNWHNRVEAEAKYRLIDESPKSPAVAVGFSSQGHGRFDESREKYDIKSKGFYGIVSRNFLLFGNLGVHGGINYSLEDTETDNDINFFVGLDKSLGNQINLLCEYDFALNDNELDEDSSRNTDSDNKYEGNGFLNAGISIKVNNNFRIKLSAYDLLENNPETTAMDRAILIKYFFSY